MEPLYKHDCSECTYVKSGTYGVYEVDWYVCGNVVVYRHGNQQSEAGAISFEGKDQIFIEAYGDVYAILEESRNNQ